MEIRRGNQQGVTPAVRKLGEQLLSRFAGTETPEPATGVRVANPDP